MQYHANRKAISPVVTTALLMVVAVVAIVSFQGWFQTFSTALQGNAESEGATLGKAPRTDVVGESLFLNNPADQNLSIESISIGGIDCSIRTNITPGTDTLNISSCVENLSGTSEVVIVTSDGVFAVEDYIREKTSSGGTSLSWCYQEQVDVATGCGGLDTGSFSTSGPWSSTAELTDGNWTTTAASQADAGTAYYDFNYSKPANAVDSSKLRFYSGVTASLERNVTIPSDCFSQDPIQFRASTESTSGGGMMPPTGSTTLSCYNGTAWRNLENNTGDGGGIYEAAMWWRMQ